MPSSFPVRPALVALITSSLPCGCGSDEVLKDGKGGCALLDSEEALATIDRQPEDLVRSEGTDEACSYITEQNDLVRWEQFEDTDFDDLVNQLDWANAEQVQDVGDRAVATGSVLGLRLGNAQVVSARGDDLLVVSVRVAADTVPLDPAIKLARRLWTRIR